MIDKLYKSRSTNTIMAKLTNHFQWTRLITPLPNKHYELDSEDDSCSGCLNVSHQQQFFSELPSPEQSHYMNMWWSILFFLLQIMSNHMSLAFFLDMLRSEPSVPVHLFKALNFPNLDSSPKESTCTWLLQAMCGGWFLCQYPCRSSSCYMTNSSVWHWC